jgi:osmoprotectant transport system ATP-binding protein
MLQFDAVVKQYGTRVAVDGVTLACTGGTTALLGPSGCGKSTLLRLAIGLVAPDAGQVRLFGEALTSQNTQTLRHRVGYVIQEGGLFPHLDVQRNVTLVARQLGWKEARCHERFEFLRELVQLPADAARRYPDELSGGQRQRVSLMRALMLDPELLLLDEPLGALDPLIRHDLQRELARLFTTLGRTVVLVTHDVAEAGTLADRLVLLRAGRIVQEGTLRELVERPASPFVADFLATQRGVRDVLEERGT